MLKDFPLHELNTWRVGGNCSTFYAPASVEDAQKTVLSCINEKERIFILGGGSNVLINDGAIDYAVLHTGKMNRITAHYVNDMVELEAECGCSTKRLLALTIENGFGGLEFLTGIPGTIGGAVWGNAGARGEAGFEQVVESAETVERGGETRKYGKNELDWKYRSCPLDESNSLLVTKCTFLLHKSDRMDIVSRIRKFSDLKKGQPLGRHTAGCVFKNPDGYSAGRLLDECGCRGMKVGEAAVSEAHANFIENTGKASARDIFELSEKCRDIVLRNSGVKLEYEIHFLGTFTKNTKKN